jgi:hypothetical protein
LVTTDAATPTTTTTFAAAQDRLPPPPPVIDISSSPAASPARAEKSEDDNENENENENEENEEEEDEGVVEEDFGFSENDELDDDDDDEDDGADHLAKEAQDGKGSLMDELFPEDAQQKRRREEKERRQQWLRNFHPPGVPIPVLPPEIIRYVCTETWSAPHDTRLQAAISICRLGRSSSGAWRATPVSPAFVRYAPRLCRPRVCYMATDRLRNR